MNQGVKDCSLEGAPKFNESNIHRPMRNNRGNVYSALSFHIFIFVFLAVEKLRDAFIGNPCAHIYNFLQGYVWYPELKIVSLKVHKSLYYYNFN